MADSSPSLEFEITGVEISCIIRVRENQDFEKFQPREQGRERRGNN